MPHLYFHEKSDYSEENTCDNEVFRTTILHHGKKLNIFTLQFPFYYIQYQNRKSRLVQMRTLQKHSEKNRLSLCRCGCNASTKIQEHEEIISPSSFYGHLHKTLRPSLGLQYWMSEFSYRQDGILICILITSDIVNFVWKTKEGERKTLLC